MVWVQVRRGRVLLGLSSEQTPCLLICYSHKIVLAMKEGRTSQGKREAKLESSKELYIKKDKYKVRGEPPKPISLFYHTM